MGWLKGKKRDPKSVEKSAEGNYWHSLPEQIEKDKIRDDVNLKEKRNTLRLPEYLIKDSPEKVLEVLGSYL